VRRMKTLPVNMDDELDAALDMVCAEQGLKKADLVVDIVRKYVETERLKRALQDPSLAALYEQLADEDVSLAEEGMADYQQILEAAAAAPGASLR
jgi:metal-responsive CopG/Arc/MetJ family transcriptional regulator